MLIRAWNPSGRTKSNKWQMYPKFKLSAKKLNRFQNRFRTRFLPVVDILLSLSLTCLMLVSDIRRSWWNDGIPKTDPRFSDDRSFDPFG